MPLVDEGEEAGGVGEAELNGPCKIFSISVVFLVA
jgi:hypothetical protein